MTQTCSLEVGNWVRNGSPTPGIILELRELKPGYPKAIVQWEDKLTSKIEDLKDLTSIDLWRLDWQWRNGKFIRLHDKKECFNLKDILAEIKLCSYYLQKAQMENQKKPSESLAKEISDRTEKISYLKQLKLQKIIIDSQFLSLIPPPSEEEKLQLETNLLKEGCRDAIVLWGNVLIDGHNRLPICRKHEIDPPIHFQEFENFKEAHDWIIFNQLGRRNISKDWASQLRGQVYNARKNRRGGNKGNHHTKKINMNDNNRVLSLGHFVLKVEGDDNHRVLSLGQNVAQDLAGKFGVNEKTIKRDGKFAQAINKICNQFGEKLRVPLLSSKLAKGQIIEIAQYIEREDFLDEIEAILKDVEFKDNFKTNYSLFKRKINPPQIAVNQLVKIKYKDTTGLTEEQRHCDREYGLVAKAWGSSYQLLLLGNRLLQVKPDDLEIVPVVEYSISFNAEEFKKLCNQFQNRQEVEEECKKGLILDA